MRIHFLSNSPKVKSGFSKVTENLARELMKLGHDCVMTGMQTTVVPEYYDLGDNFKLECLPLSTNLDEVSQFQQNIMITNPDVVIYVGEAYTDVFRLAKFFPKTISYVPIEGVGIPQYMINDLNGIVKRGGKVIAQCQYGYNEMKRCGVNVEKWIYHGYDTNIYKPIDNWDSKELISFAKCVDGKWTQMTDMPMNKLKSEFKGKFVYLFVGQNNLLRKRIELLLEAFNIFINEFPRQKRDRIHLHLHTLPRSPTGLDLLDYIELYKLDIKDNISFSYGTWRSSGFSEEGLNILYNLADCFVSATSSEGYGLGHIESMACGIPQITPDCTSLTELVGTGENARGLLAKIKMEHTIQDLTKRGLVDIVDLANKMKIMYQNNEDRERYSKNCLLFVQPYSWKKIANEFDNVIKQMV